MLGAAVDRGLDAGICQILLSLVDDLPELTFSLRCRLGHHPHYLVIDLGLQGGESQILKLPFDGIHAEPVGQRREDVQGIARDAYLFVRAQKGEGSHVVQPVPQFYDEHSHVPGGSHHQLADGFCLGRFAVGQLVEFGDPIDQLGDFSAEVGA